MLIKQISVFLGNNPGRLATVAQKLAESNIDIRALCIADTTDFGVLRVIVDDTESAFEKLNQEGFAANITDVIAVEMDDKPGSMSVCLNVLREAEIGIEYMYAFTGRVRDKAFVVIRADDNVKASEVLKSKNITVMDSQERL